jgi:putative PIN family toxin of toxin-antitoxin system
MSEYQNPPFVVCDCMIFLQAVANENGPAAAVLRLLDQDAISLFVSEPILEEVRDVLSRAEVRARNKGITDARMYALLARLAEKAIAIKNVPEEFHYERDPDDEPYINLALTTRAQYLVTRDTDLLDLMDESTEAGKDFRFKYPFLRILDPLVFLRETELKKPPG